MAEGVRPRNRHHKTNCQRGHVLNAIVVPQLAGTIGCTCKFVWLEHAEGFTGFGDYKSVQFFKLVSTEPVGLTHRVALEFSGSGSLREHTPPRHQSCHVAASQSQYCAAHASALLLLLPRQFHMAVSALSSSARAKPLPAHNVSTNALMLCFGASRPTQHVAGRQRRHAIR